MSRILVQQQIGNNFHFGALFLRKLCFYIENAYWFHFITKKVATKRHFESKRKNIDNASAYRELSRFVHKINTHETIFKQHFGQKIDAQRLSHFQFEHAGSHAMHRNNLLHQSFRISYHHTWSRIIGQPVQHFGSQYFVGSVELTQFYCFFERRRKIKHFIGSQYLFQVVIKIPGFIGIVHHHYLALRQLIEQGSSH